MLVARRNHRMPRRFVLFGLKSDGTELVDDPVGARLHLRGAGGIGGYAGKAQELEEIVNGGVFHRAVVL